MYFYCAELAFKKLKDPLVKTNECYEKNIYSWHVLLIPGLNETFLFFMNDGSGMSFILRFEQDKELKIDREIISSSIHTVMKDMEYSDDLISQYLSIPWGINISSLVDYDHMEVVAETIINHKEAWLENIEHNSFLQRKLSSVFNNRHIEWWFGYLKDNIPREMMKQMIHRFYQEL